MELDEVQVFDMLAYSSDELLRDFSKCLNDADRTNSIEIYLEKFTKSPVNTVDDFQKDLDWFNVTQPINLSNLKGKLVILDFFTYCCINCVHILPDLKYLEHVFPPESGLVILGVHSAKFDNEKDSSKLLSAIQRYKITHPVVNDVNSKMWTKLGIKCWPTLLVLSPSGNPLLVLMGEGHRTFLNKFVETSISFYDKRNQLKNFILPFNPSMDRIQTSHLRFPGKICCRFITKLEKEIIAVSDSGNNRIILLETNGHIFETVGGFETGFVNGNFRIAKFNFPQGLSFLNDDILLIADTGNHAIRTINLKTQEVSTIAGNGVQGRDKVGGSSGLEQSLSSPWDLVVYKTKDMDMSFHLSEESVTEKDIILIAMSGTHQIWAIFLDSIIWWKFRKYENLTCVAIIGNGSEENRNNSYPQNAAFAQPSGLTLYRDTVFVADSESSSIRKITMIDGKVTGLVGGDRNPLNLFTFGDIDGKQFNARLQHPMGVCHNPHDDFLYIADTYNNKIKRVNIKTSVIETCPIKAKNNLDIYQFNEPNGLCCGSEGTILYVTDTNNHSIQIVDLKNMSTWPLILNFNAKLFEKEVNHLETLQKSIKIKKNARVVLRINLTCDKDIKLTENAPQKWSIRFFNGGISADYKSGTIINNSFVITCNVNNDDTVENGASIYCGVSICNNDVCMYKEISTKIKFVYSMDSDFFINENINIFISLEKVHLLDK